MELFFKNKVWDFRPVHKYPGYYVNEYGVIYSEKRKRFCTPVVQRFYLYARLSKKRKKHVVPIHRIVCRAFNGPPPPHNKISNHKDFDTMNNHYTNLEWANFAVNQHHRRDNGGGISPAEKLKRYGKIRTLQTYKQIPD